MLFLPGIELCLEEFDTEFKFLIDDNLYFLYEESDVWQMRCLNTRNFQLSSIQVNTDDEMSLTDFYHTAVVQNRKAYLWNYEEQHLLEGAHDNDGFHWNNVETTGDVPDIGISFGFADGTTSYYCVIQMDDNEGVEYLYQLNLSTLVWNRQTIHHPIQEIVDVIAASPLRNWHWDTYVAGSRVHFLPSISKAERYFLQLKVHLVLDLVSLETSFLPYENHSEDPAPMFYRHSVFIYDQHLWMFGKKQSSVDEKLTLYRCDTDAQKWIEVATPAGGPVSDHIREPTTMDSRVLFMTPCRITHTGKTQKMAHVLDFEPSLLDRAAVILARDPDRVEHARRSLPAHIIKDLIERRIFPCEEEDDQIINDEDECTMEDQREGDKNEEKYDGDEDDNEIPHKRNRVE